MKMQRKHSLAQLPCNLIPQMTFKIKQVLEINESDMKRQQIVHRCLRKKQKASTNLCPITTFSLQLEQPFINSVRFTPEPVTPRIHFRPKTAAIAVANKLKASRIFQTENTWKQNQNSVSIPKQNKSVQGSFDKSSSIFQSTTNKPTHRILKQSGSTSFSIKTLEKSETIDSLRQSEKYTFQQRDGNQSMLTFLDPKVDTQISRVQSSVSVRKQLATYTMKSYLTQNKSPKTEITFEEKSSRCDRGEQTIEDMDDSILSYREGDNDLILSKTSMDVKQHKNSITDNSINQNGPSFISMNQPK